MASAGFMHGVAWCIRGGLFWGAGCWGVLEALEVAQASSSVESPAAASCKSLHIYLCIPFNAGGGSSLTEPHISTFSCLHDDGEPGTYEVVPDYIV